VFQETGMDAEDRRLINLLQEGLPLEKDPFGILARRMGLERAEIVARTDALIRAGYIRRLGGVFDSRAMGYSSVLVGARVPDDLFEDVAEFVNAIPGVTHNYRRKGFLNMWFTLSVSREEEKEAVLDGLRNRYDLTHVFPFSKLKNFKLRVFFDMESE